MNREELMAATKADPDSKPVEVTIKHWGKIYIRALSAAEVDDINRMEKQGERDTSAFTAARLICDENGNRLFDPKNEGDLSYLGALPSHKLNILFKAHSDLVSEAVEGNSAGVKSS